MNKNNFKIHFMNTVWSDCMILERNNHFALIDTASEFYYPNLKAYIDSLNIKTFDFILLTHFHSDHYGNVSKIINDYKVSRLYLKHYSAHESSKGDGKKSDKEYFNHEKGKYKDIIDSANNNKVKQIFLDDLDKDNYKITFQGLPIELYNLRNVLNDMYNDEKSPYYMQELFSENANSVPAFIKINNHTIYLASDLTDSAHEDERINFQNQTIIKHIYKKHHINSLELCKSAHHGGGGTNKLDLTMLMKTDYIVITNTDKYLDNWNTIANFKEVNPNVTILKTDYYKYVFDFSNEEISYISLSNVSPFIELAKN